MFSFIEPILILLGFILLILFWPTSFWIFVVITILITGHNWLQKRKVKK